MSSTKAQNLATVFFLMVLCPLKLALCKSIDDGFEIEAFDEVVEKKVQKTPHQDYMYQKREIKDNKSQILLNRCYSGNVIETVKALGVLDIPGVRLLRVSDELLKRLLHNKFVVVKNSSGSAYNDESTAKRSSTQDMCDEVVDQIYMLAHANEQLAYQVETVRCEGSSSLCLVNNFGECVLRKQTVIVYLLDSSNNFYPETVEIGCACECKAYI